MKVAIMAQVVYDEFERGQCDFCPFGIDTEDGDRYCTALWNYDECALKIEEADE